MKQNWKPVEGFPDYLVSDQGNVLSKLTWSVLKPQTSGPDRQYRHVTLRRGRKSFIQKVHRLVALAFIPNPHNKPTVNHEDGVKSNNVATNLTWATYKEQEAHAKKTGLKTYTHNVGGKHPRAKSVQRSDGKKYDSVMDAARELGISNGCSASIINVANGKNLTAYGYAWSWTNT